MSDDDESADRPDDESADRPDDETEPVTPEAGAGDGDEDEDEAVTDEAGSTEASPEQVDEIGDDDEFEFGEDDEAESGEAPDASPETEGDGVAPEVESEVEPEVGDPTTTVDAGRADAGAEAEVEVERTTAEEAGDPDAVDDDSPGGEDLASGSEPTAEPTTGATAEPTTGPTAEPTTGTATGGGVDTGVASQVGGDEKNPALSAIASLIIPGAGQFLNDQPQRAIIAFLGAIVIDAVIFFVGLILTVILIGPLLWLLIPVVHVGIAYDAYNQAQKINSGEVTV